MKIIEAKRSGVSAYNEGRKMAPMFNNAFIKAACESETDTAELLNAYSYGWTIANLADQALPGAPSIQTLAEIVAT